MLSWNCQNLMLELVVYVYYCCTFVYSYLYSSLLSVLRIAEINSRKHYLPSNS